MSHIHPCITTMAISGTCLQPRSSAQAAEGLSGEPQARWRNHASEQAQSMQNKKNISTVAYYRRNTERVSPDGRERNRRQCRSGIGLQARSSNRTCFRRGSVSMLADMNTCIFTIRAGQGKTVLMATAHLHFCSQRNPIRKQKTAPCNIPSYQKLSFH